MPLVLMVGPTRLLANARQVATPSSTRHYTSPPQFAYEDFLSSHRWDPAAGIEQRKRQGRMEREGQCMALRSAPCESVCGMRTDEVCRSLQNSNMVKRATV